MFKKHHDHRNEINTDDSLDARLQQMGQKIRAPYKLRNAAKTGVPLHGEDERRIAPARPRLGLPKIAALAMSALLAVGGGFGIAVEAQAYNEAIDFFEQYNLSAEGFTRSEVKKIYKDIISKSFTYEKTEEALASGLEGYEIQTKPLDSEGLKRVWLTGYQYKAEQKEEKPISQYYYRYDDSRFGLPYINHGSVLCQYKNKNDTYKDRLWEIYLANIGNAQMTPTPTGAMVIGMPAHDDFGIYYKLRIYAFNDDSTEAWRKDLDCPLATPRVQYLIYDDGIITVFATQQPYNYLWIAKIDLDGNIIEQQMLDNYEYTGYKVEKILTTADGYLMLLSHSRVVRVKDNRIETSIDYNNAESCLIVSDIVEYNGLIYLSGECSRWDLYGLYFDQFGEDGATVEEAFEFGKEHYSAVLLICDPRTGEPMSFYSVPAASGGALEVKDGKLNWEVKRLRSLIRGTGNGSGDIDPFIWLGDYGTFKCDLWQYVFTPYGQIAGEKDTGKTVSLYK